MATMLFFAAILVNCLLFAPLVKATVRMSSFRKLERDDCKFASSLLFERASRLHSECARQCASDDQCETFTHVEGLCRGHSDVATAVSAAPCTAATGARTYGKQASMGIPATTISPGGICDQQTDNGGWTVFQRRLDGSVDFYRNWNAYKAGFGDAQGEFWLGLDALHSLTSTQTAFQLRVDLLAFSGTTACATYSNFSTSGSSDNYTLHLGSYTGGTAGDSLSLNNGQQFTTWDQDHDTWEGSNCASLWHGAWWYTACGPSTLNGRYSDSRVDRLDAVRWYSFDEHYSLKSTEMKIRPV